MNKIDSKDPLAICYYCQEYGHFTRKCPEIICKSCFIKGHAKIDCSRKCEMEEGEITDESDSIVIIKSQEKEDKNDIYTRSEISRKFESIGVDIENEFPTKSKMELISIYHTLRKQKVLFNKRKPEDQGLMPISLLEVTDKT